MPHLAVIGCSHHNAPVATRERLAFTPQKAEEALRKFRATFPGTEAVLVSTCNRVELYTAQEEGAGPGPREIAEFLAACHGLDPGELFEELFRQDGEDAVRHLFLVAASLDSMVLGEAQILAQVKQAYELGCKCDSTGPLTHIVFQRAAQVAKRVATETAIQQKRISIPSVAVGDFAKEIFERFDDKQVLIIGAGEMGEETLRYLVDEGAKHIVVINRNRERAEALAAKFQAKTDAWSRLDALLTTADVVVTTTAATEPIMTAERFAPIHDRRNGSPLLILDLAIPRDFEPNLSQKFSEVYLYDIGDLTEVCEANAKRRRREQDQAVKIVNEETSRFMSDLRHRAASPVIRRLRQDWQQIKQSELERLFKRLPELDDRTRDEVEQSFERLLNKLLHPPLESLRDESTTGVPEALLGALKTLFRIKD
jgi:glutamyl-tRNA reductase